VGKSQREKGKRGERAAAKVLSLIFPDAARSHSQSTGALEPDVKYTPYFIEVKVGARPPILQGFRQARKDTDGRPPLVLSKQDRGEWLVTMSLDEFARLQGVITKMVREDDLADKLGEFNEEVA
jgi:hypothetical protein